MAVQSILRQGPSITQLTRLDSPNPTGHTRNETEIARASKMPVKWTPDNDQLLLLKILETHELNVDPKRISEAWPKDRGEVPTPRAISERLLKIRQNARNNGAVGFTISSVKSSKAASGVASSKKATASAGKSNHTNSQVSSPSVTRGQKRKRENDVKIEDSDEDDYGLVKQEHVASHIGEYICLGSQNDVSESEVDSTSGQVEAQHDGAYSDDDDNDEDLA